MNKQFTIAFIGSFVLAVIIILIDYAMMSKGSRLWGMYGLSALYISGVYFVAGITMVFFERTRMVGKAFLLASVLMALIGQSICSGTIRI